MNESIVGSTFGELAEIYGTGTFRGFDLDDVKRSSIVFDWIANVMRYTSLLN